MSETWLMDGPSRTAPPPFRQVYTVHTLINGYDVPAVYAVLASKSKRIYVHFLTKLFDLLAVDRVRAASIDFELAMAGAIHDVRPALHLHGCFFHFCQAVD